MQKKTTDPLEALDRAFREIGLNVGEGAEAKVEAARGEPLEVLRSLAGDRESPDLSPTPTPEPTAPAPTGPARALATTGARQPVDPLEALRRLEKALTDPAAPQASHPLERAESTTAAGDPLQALKELEQKESDLWAHGLLSHSESDEPEPAAAPVTPSLRAIDEELARKLPEERLPDAPAASAAPKIEQPAPIEEPPASPALSEATPPRAARPEPPPLPAAGPAPRPFAASLANRLETRPPRSAEPAVARSSARLSPATGAFQSSRRRRQVGQAETKPTVDPGVAARAAFYRARQELGEDASLDEIIKHACRDLDRASQEILFEIQLKILLGQSL